MSAENPFSYRPDEPSFDIRFTNGTRRLQAHNTFEYSFSEHEEGDHIFMASRLGRAGVVGFHLWKLDMAVNDSIGNYMELRQEVRKLGCRQIHERRMDDADIAAFQRKFGRLPAVNEARDFSEYPQGDIPFGVTPIPSLEKRELTGRQERFMGYYAYLLDQNYIMPPDFHTPEGVIL